MRAMNNPAKRDVIASCSSEPPAIATIASMSSCRPSPVYSAAKLLGLFGAES